MCRIVSFGNRHLTEAEKNDFRLSTVKLKYEEAIAEYERRRDSAIGRLIARRELPMLKRAKQVLSIHFAKG